MGNQAMNASYGRFEGTKRTDKPGRIGQTGQIGQIDQTGAIGSVVEPNQAGAASLTRARSETPTLAPAFYARKGGAWADFWTILHPPYTLWNMSFTVMGSALAPTLDGRVLALMLLAFLAGTGVAAHALDELNGRPLRTGFSNRALKTMALAALGAALLCALLGLLFVSAWIIPLALLGALLVAAYNLEWWGGLVHTDLGFALSWGGFPVLVGYWSQAEALSLGALLLAAAATLMSLAQRALSTPARFLRRKARSGGATFDTGKGQAYWDRTRLLAGYERPLRLLSWMAPALACAMLLARLGG